MEGKYIIKTDAWFYGPDGKQYNAVWGDVEIMSDSILGIKTNARSSNWYAKVGTEENHVVIAGCQIHYATKCNAEPDDNLVDDYSIDSGKVTQFKRPNNIYVAK